LKVKTIPFFWMLGTILQARHDAFLLPGETGTDDAGRSSLQYVTEAAK
jgi:hypothetical protein